MTNNETYFKKVTKETYSNNISEKENVKDVNKESGNIKDYFIHPSEDHNRMNLCEDCEKGLWSYIHGTKLENDK